MGIRTGDKGLQAGNVHIILVLLMNRKSRYSTSRRVYYHIYPPSLAQPSDTVFKESVRFINIIISFIVFAGDNKGPSNRTVWRTEGGSVVVYIFVRSKNVYAQFANDHIFYES